MRERVYSIMPMNSGRDYKARETDLAQPLMAGGPVGGNQGGDYVIQQRAQAVAIRGRDGGAAAELGGEQANALRASSGGGDKAFVLAPTVVHGTQDPCVSDVAFALGRNSGQENAVFSEKAIGFSAKDYGADATDEVSPTLRAMGHQGSHANAGGQVAVAFVQNTRDEVRLMGGDGQIVGALAAQTGMKQQAYISDPPMAVRRLMPVECERLQGFPDGWTDVPVGKKRAADGPRYKQLGNSWAVPCVTWIARRIQAEVDRLDAMPAAIDLDYDAERMIWAMIL